jgi:Lysyl oxidase
MKKMLVSIISGLGLIAGLVLVAPAHAATEVLPDLRSRGLTDFRIEVASNGDKRLRFTTQIANLGPGPFEVYAKRPTTNTANMAVFQRVHNTAGGYRSIAVSGTHAYYAGDGHDHWHIYKLQELEIRKLKADGTEGSKAGSGAKLGFCFWDNTVYNLTLPNARKSPRYKSCGTETSLSIKTGISVGWADTYGANLAYQWIKINGLPDGKYKVRVRTDPKNWFVESVESNNSISTTVKITGNSVVRLPA